jgi:hypothetical protein
MLRVAAVLLPKLKIDKALGLTIPPSILAHASASEMIPSEMIQ